MSKGFAQPFLIIALFIVTIFAALGFYKIINKKQDSSTAFVKQNNIIASLKKNSSEYTSPLGFVFKYSNDLIVKEDSEEGFNKRSGGDFRKNFASYVQYQPGKFLAAVSVLEQSANYDLNPLTLWVFDNPQDLSIDSWYKNYWYYPFVWGDFTYTGKFELAPKMEATISGQVSKSGVIDYQPGKPKFVYLSRDKKMYLFRIIGETGDKILSTFKFIN